MGRRTAFAVAAAVVAALCVANVAQALTTTYTNRGTWETASGATIYTVDFESFASDTSFATTPLDVGPFTLSTNGTAAAGRNIVDVTPFMFSGVPASFGDAATDIYLDGLLTADLTFGMPVSGFFADFLYPGNTQQLDLTLSLLGGGTTDLTVPGTGTTLESFGFLSTDPVTSIRFNNSVNDGFYIDNISGAPIPEPATLGLLGFAFAGLVAYRRKRK